MTWLMLQSALWCLAGAFAGALAAWLLAVMLFPHENELRVDEPPAGPNKEDA